MNGLVIPATGADAKSLGPGLRRGDSSLDSLDGCRLEPQLGGLALAPPPGLGVVERTDLQDLFTVLVAADAGKHDAAQIGNDTDERVLLFEIDQHQAAPAVGHGLELGDVEGED